MRANGKDFSLATPTALSDFLVEQGYQIERVVVERNGEIITRERFSQVILSDDDRLEIVHFVGGG